MKGKLERQRIIREVIKDNRVSNQEELSTLLEQRGLSVAQATLSRDIRELRITKIHDGSGYSTVFPSLECCVTASVNPQCHLIASTVWSFPARWR